MPLKIVMQMQLSQLEEGTETRHTICRSLRLVQPFFAQLTLVPD